MKIVRVVRPTSENGPFKIWLRKYEEAFNADGWAEASLILPKQLSLEHPSLVTVLDKDAFFIPSWFEVEKIFEIPFDKIPNNLIALHLWESKSMEFLKNIKDWDWAEGNKDTLYGKIIIKIVDKELKRFDKENQRKKKKERTDWEWGEKN